MDEKSIYPRNPDESFLEYSSTVLKKCQMQKDTNIVTVNTLQKLAIEALEELSRLKSNDLKQDEYEALLQTHNSITNQLVQIIESSLVASNSGQCDLRKEAFCALVHLLPHQSILGKKVSFPDNNFSELIKIVITSKGSITVLTNVIKELLSYPDISSNIWKALELACCKLIPVLSLQEVNNVIQLINITEKPKAKDSSSEMEVGPQPFYCRVTDGVLSEKEIQTSIRKLWNKLITVTNMPQKTMQMLLLTLLERLMPRMKRPIFLTDFFMSTLEVGGSVSILALQGIFTLYKDENMNYPDVYRKLYSMISPEIFQAQYKARFYYLTDIFLSSSHLPEALVASFIKKFARLSLLAPPPDAIILMAFIVNLLIRHKGLKKLIHNPTETTYESDPYNENETDPSLTQAIDSSLWEVQLLANHVVPSVSAATNFINNPLPKVEIDIGPLLEVTIDEMFEKELKKKMKNPPVSFEKPSSLFVPNVRSGFSEWNLGGIS